MKNLITEFKRAVRAKDAKLVGKAVDALRAAGCSYRECYRAALAGDPTLTEAEWEDLMLESE